MKGTKFKTLLVMALALMFVVGLFGCSGGGSAPSPESGTESSGTAESGTSSSATPASGTQSQADWNSFIDEYEKWADDYVAFIDKYLENPTDPSLITEYTQLASEVSEWSQRANDLANSLTTEEALELTQRLVPISEKITAAAAKFANAS